MVLVPPLFKASVSCSPVGTMPLTKGQWMCGWILLLCHVLPRQGTFPKLPCQCGATSMRINPAYPDVLTESPLLQDAYTHSGVHLPPKPQTVWISPSLSRTNFLTASPWRGGRRNTDLPQVSISLSCVPPSSLFWATLRSPPHRRLRGTITQVTLHSLD